MPMTSTFNTLATRSAASLPIALRKFVLARLHEFAITGPVKRNRPPRMVVRRDL